jgi:hypothetical protein
MNIYKAEGVNNMDRYVPGQDVYNVYNNIRQWTKKFGLYQVLVASTNLEYSKRQWCERATHGVGRPVNFCQSENRWKNVKCDEMFLSVEKTSHVLTNYEWLITTLSNTCKVIYGIFTSFLHEINVF